MTRKLPKISLTLLICVVISLSSLSALAQLPPAVVGESDGFVDINIPVSRVARGAGGAASFEANGQAATKSIGIAVDILPGWKESKPSNAKFGLAWGRVRLRSLGAPSDAFLSLLAAKYRLAATDLRMVDQLELPAACLGCNPETDGSKPLHMKAFFEGTKQDEYAEVYLNISKGDTHVEFHEKDPDYRRPLLKALARK